MKTWFAIVLAATAVNGALASARVLVEAHRGASFAAPENTLASITAAVGSADLTEFDVRETADGKLVLMHDSTVDRTTNGTGLLASLTLSQVQSLDAGSWFSPAFAGEQAPTMIDAISHALERGITPLIERKAGGASTYHNEFVGAGLAPNDFRLISFDWGFLSGLHALDANYSLGALGSGALDQAVINTAVASGADFLDWSHSGITQATVDLVHANGLELHTWTVNDAGRMQQLIDYGVDGITTDSPEVLQQLAYQANRSVDLNLDGVVNDEDWRLFNATRGTEFNGMSLMDAYALGDLDGDLDNDIADFVIFKELYLAETTSTSFGAQQIAPEPNSLTACLCGLLLLSTTGVRSIGRQWG
ncbi:MAG: hypothetical protein KDA37_14100 [Planctomycetales bacterium]|nr:hypothetical protein [Planctomycetales bacterium]